MSEIVFSVTGTRIDATPRTRGIGDVPARGSNVTQVRVGGFRAGESVHELVATTGEDLVSLQLANDGPELILSPQTAKELFEAQGENASAQRSAGSAQSIVVPTSGLAWPNLGAEAQAQRGVVQSVAIALFSVFKGKARDVLTGGDTSKTPDLAEWTAEKIGDIVDSKVTEGVYPLSLHAPWPLNGRATSSKLSPGSKPHLVFIHGTFVNTEATFGNLFESFSSLIGELSDKFELHALDHATLRSSPIENALTLVRACDNDVHLHLLTHSRGGMVAEVLVRAIEAKGRTADAEAYKDPEGKPGGSPQKLRELIELAHAKRIVVERVTRVACPVRGTLLASGRLDAYLSILRWSLKLAGVPGDPLLGFLQAVASKRTDPKILPGLEAMMPNSALVEFINSGPPTLTQLRVVAGDVRGDSLGGWVKTLVSDSFFWTDNDLVVQTRSMYGGVPRAKGIALYRLFSSGKATHFDYFKNNEIALSIHQALSAPQPQEFRPIGPESWQGESASGERGIAATLASPSLQPDKPVLFVLPGILGSHLRVANERVWLSHKILSGLDRLEYPVQDATPDGVVETSYANLIRYFQSTHHVVPFSYDWRKPIEHEARRLGELVQQALAARAATNQPVRFIAHSMGGLVVRTFMLECRETWDRVCAHPQARLLMLGTPNAGSWVPMQVFTGDDNFGNLLAFAGSPFSSQKGRDLMARMPGFVQLQADLTSATLGERSGWAALERQDLAAVPTLWHHLGDLLGLNGWALPGEDALALATNLRRRWDAQIVQGKFNFAERTSIVVGRAPRTPDGYRTSQARGIVYLDVVEGGDGTVTHQSACLPGVNTWQVPEEHSKLADFVSAFEAYEELITTGTTRGLDALGSIQRGELAKPLLHVETRPARMRDVPMPPASFEALMRQPQLAFANTSDQPPLWVSVQAGDFRFIREPLLMGHYSATTLRGAELVMDRLLGGSLQKYLDTNAYPMHPGESSTFVNTIPSNPFARIPRPQGLVVVGLGNESSLRPTQLQTTITKGVLNWVKTIVHSVEGGTTDLALATTLVGSGGMGITPAMSARSIVIGVQQANKRLRAVGWPLITRLTLIELYKDRAREAHMGVSMLGEVEGHHVRIDPEIAQGEFAKQSMLSGTYRGASYDMVGVEDVSPNEQPTSVLRFAVSTRRSRTEVETHTVQGPLLQQIISAGSQGTFSDPQISKTLFRMLVPRSMTDLLGQSKSLVLELDESIAGIPWEVFHDDDILEGTEPWAIACQLVRKLRLEGYRTQPLDARVEDAVLVIGEPQCDPTLYPRLPGALEEARAVAKKIGEALDSQLRVIPVENADAPNVVKHLNTQPYRIIHIAGHGESGEDKGVVLSGKSYLSPKEIRDLREVPELVFVNCCHLGTRAPVATDQIAAGRPAFAASVATALIKIGVKCVIAAGWAVDDRAAKEFAERFYECLLSKNMPFAQAVSEARKAARLAAPNSMTWAAYQCYGDPEWTFKRNSADDTALDLRTIVQESVASEEELLALLHDLTVDLRLDGHRTDLERKDLLNSRLGTRLRHLEQRYGKQYGTSGNVAEAFAAAFKFAGSLSEALAWYERAISSTDGQASLVALEQWCNVQSRLAWQEVCAAAPLHSQAVEAALSDVEAAIARLSLLCAVARTGERLSLLGSTHKHRAMILRRFGLDYEKELVTSSHYYEEACQISIGASYFYPAINVLSNRAAWGPSMPQAGLQSAERIAAIQQAAVASLNAIHTAEPNFWSAVGGLELQLYTGLVEGTLNREGVSQLILSFEDVHLRAPSSHEWRSVRDNLDFVLHAWLTCHDARAELQALLSNLNDYASY